MGDKSAIEWCDATWNPTNGCQRVSPGCESCYAERFAGRFSGPKQRYEGLVRIGKNGARWTGKMRLEVATLDVPIRWQRARRIFVNSMSDLFHPNLRDQDIAAVFGVMGACQRHTFQILTKHPDRARAWFAWAATLGGGAGYGCAFYATKAGNERAAAPDAAGIPRTDWPWPLPNVWLGCSVENQEWADRRIPHLLATSAAVRFVSYEPALGPVDFEHWIKRIDHCTSCGEENEPQVSDVCPACKSTSGLISTWGDAQAERYREATRDPSKPGEDGPQLHQIIVGGESGPRARPFNVAWARSVVRQCRTAGVNPFVKQLGANVLNGFDVVDRDAAPWPRDTVTFDASGGVHLADRKGGDMTEWPADLRVREFPAVRP